MLTGFGARLCPQAPRLFLHQERAELLGRHHAREQAEERGRQEKGGSGEAGRLKVQTLHLTRREAASDQRAVFFFSGGGRQDTRGRGAGTEGRLRLLQSGQHSGENSLREVSGAIAEKHTTVSIWKMCSSRFYFQSYVSPAMQKSTLLE